jgi:hypothetical protein
VVEIYDWERALLALYDDRIYAFEIAGNEVYIFAVHFEPEGAFRHIRYGHTLNLRDLNAATIGMENPLLAGTWRVLRFATVARQQTAQTGRTIRGAPAGLEVAYDLLELHAEADADAVKVAYRRLARLYHPDVNTSADATATMQAINAAYTQIMQRFEAQ